MSTLLSGVLGAVLAWFLVRLLKTRIRHGAGDGSLFYAPFVTGVGLVFLLLSVWFGLASGLVAAPDAQLRPALLAAGFGLGGALCLGEAVLTGGRYDDSGILFRSLWGGRRHEIWRDLLHARYSRFGLCYVLRFRSGKSIRLSVLLSGHGAVVTRLHALGHHV
jgi:hypothetical protein